MKVEVFTRKPTLTIEERTAMSILMGLRIKFSKEAKNSPQSYSSSDLERLFKELIGNMNKQKVRDLGRGIELEGRYTEWEDRIWGLVSNSVKKSKIERFPWNEILGISLTKAIHVCRNSGKSMEETFEELSNNKEIIEFLRVNEGREKEILEKLEISIHARYGENKTAEKMKSSLNN